MISPADYFGAARDLVADGDPSKVTIEALCAAVGTTSGSFYHHFGSLRGFVEALAVDWADRSIQAITEAVAEIDDLPRARRTASEQTLQLQPGVEAAFRAWGRTNEAMGKAVRSVDDARLGASRTMVAALNPNLADAEVEACAQIAMLVIVGAQAHEPSTAAKVTADALASFASLIERGQA